MDPKIGKKTQDTLGKIIKKPPLTEKLLSKPPFRFLHDIMTSVIKTTGFMKGLFTDSEINSENVKDKDSKIAFLQKAVDLVSLVTGKSMSVKPQKVVAGHEPEKTNEFLQLLASAINKKVDNDEYVARVLGGKGKGEHSKSEEKRDRGKDRSRERSEDRRKRDEDKRDREKERDRSRDKDDKHRDRDRDRKSGRRRRDEDEGKENETPDMVNGEKEPPPARMQRPSSAKGSRRRQEEGSSPQRKPQAAESSIREDDIPPQVADARKLGRPSSARPAPPRRKEDTIQNEPAMRLGSGKPTNVIVDDGLGSDDDDETFVVEESAPPPQEPEQTTMKTDMDEDEDHGALVKNIMKTKKEYEAQHTQKKDERSTMSDAQRRKQREHVQKEIDKLRGSIQTLTRSANPLGKIMDYVQEDLDSMQKELEKWKAENKEHSLALKREAAVTDRAIEPLKAQLSDVDQAIKDQLDLIAAVKSNIIRNDQKIEKMLRTIAKS